MYPKYIRDKARALRSQRRMSIDEIAERLALPRTTVFYWVRDLPLARPRVVTVHPGNRAMQLKYRRLREAAYAQGRDEFVALDQERGFRDFVCMYIGEGYKRDRNTVSLCNSDPAVVALAEVWIRRFAANPVTYALQYHADQDARDLVGFWSRHLGCRADAIRLQRKSNSGQLAKRTWRCRHGVLAVNAWDTLLRARLEAWMDCVRASWA